MASTAKTKKKAAPKKARVAAKAKAKVTAAAKKKAAPRKAARKAPAAKAPARPAAPSAPRVVRAKRSPESPAVLEGIDRSGRKSAVRELSWADFDRVVSELAQGLARFQPEAVVGVAHGGVFVGGALAAALQVEFWPVRISRRSRDQGPVAAPGLSGTMPKELAGRRVVIVDDIAASGDTLELARALAEAAGAAKVATATIVSRPGGYEPSVCWERTADFFVFPWDYHVNATT